MGCSASLEVVNDGTMVLAIARLMYCLQSGWAKERLAPGLEMTALGRTRTIAVQPLIQAAVNSSGTRSVVLLQSRNNCLAPDVLILKWAVMWERSRFNGKRHDPLRCQVAGLLMQNEMHVHTTFMYDECLADCWVMPSTLNCNPHSISCGPNRCGRIKGQRR